MKIFFRTSLLALLVSLSFACQKKAIPESTAKVSPESTEKVSPTTVAEDAVLLESGQTKLHTGDNQGAIQELDNAIKLNPQNADAYYWRAVAKCYLSDNAGCCADYEKAAKLGHPSAADMVQKYCK